MKNKQNMKKHDRIIRFIVGTIALIIAIWFNQYLLLLLTGVLYITAGLGFCPFYHMCFLRQCKIK